MTPGSSARDDEATARRARYSSATCRRSARCSSARSARSPARALDALLAARVPRRGQLRGARCSCAGAPHARSPRWLISSCVAAALAVRRRWPVVAAARRCSGSSRVLPGGRHGHHRPHGGRRSSWCCSCATRCGMHDRGRGACGQAPRSPRPRVVLGAAVDAYPGRRSRPTSSARLPDRARADPARPASCATARGLNRALREQRRARRARARAGRPTRPRSRSARGSPASCTTSSRTR